MIEFLVFYFVTIPFCTLMHEIGHGFATTLTSEGVAHIHLGNKNDQNKQTFNLGRLYFHLKWSHFGLCAFEGKLSRKQRLVILMGGPLMSLALYFMFTFLTLYLPEGNIQLFISNTALYCIISFFVTALPIRYPRWMGLYSSMESDGLQVLNLLRNKDSQAVKSSPKKDE